MVNLLPIRPIDTSWMERCGVVGPRDLRVEVKERRRIPTSMERLQTAREIVEKAAREFGFTRAAIIGPSRSVRFAEARLLAADSLSARYYTPEEIAHELGRRRGAIYKRWQVAQK